MDLSKYEYQSEFARRFVAQGREEGREQGLAEGRSEGRTAGRTDLLTRQLTRRFGPLPEAARSHLARASIDELDAIGERLLMAQDLREALGSIG